MNSMQQAFGWLLRLKLTMATMCSNNVQQGVKMEVEVIKVFGKIEMKVTLNVVKVDVAAA